MNIHGNGFTVEIDSRGVYLAVRYKHNWTRLLWENSRVIIYRMVRLTNRYLPIIYLRYNHRDGLSGTIKERGLRFD